MSTDRPDSSEDLDDIPTLRPVRPGDNGDDLDRDDYREELPPRPPRKPGFGFWMSGVWCLLYLIATQVVVGGGVGVIGSVIVLAQVMQENNGVMPPVNEVNADPRMVTAMMVALACAHFSGILFSLLMLRLVIGKTWRRRVALTRLPSPTHVVLIVIAFPAVLALVGALEEPVLRHVPSLKDLIDLPGLEEFMKTLPSWPLWAALLTIAVGPGIGEELWCRGYLGAGTSARYGPVWSVVITSFYFGLIHVEPPQAIFAMMLGLIIHSSYLATRSLPACMVMHFANNAAVVLHEGGHAKILNPLIEAAASSPVLFVASALFLFAAVAYALYQTRGKLVSVEPGMPAWQPMGKGAVELPPPNSGTVVRHDPISPVSVALVLTGAVGFGLVMAFA